VNWTFVYTFLNSGDITRLLLILARWAGLLAVFFVLIQFFLMARNRWLEKIFGFPSLSRVHHTCGLLAIIFILCHPFFLTLSYARIDNLSLNSQFADFLQNYSFVFFAFLSFLLFIALTLISLYKIKNKLSYETWYGVHLLAYIAIVLAFPHQLAVGSDFISHPMLVIFWYFLYAFVFINLLLFRFIVPLINFFRYSFKVQNIKKEGESVYSVYIKGRNLNQFSIKAGQFLILRFLDKNFWWQAHPFSVSQLPGQDIFRMTIKSVGDFTNQIKDIQINTSVIIEGPYGTFTSSESKKNKILFIAGGIGITPIRVLIEEMGKMGKDMVLIYSNKTQTDVVFEKELSFLVQKFQLKLFYIFTHDQNFPDKNNRVDMEKIQKLVSDVNKREIYICGPQSMLNSLTKDMKSRGIPDRQVHFEKFSL
jgi:predicted ferric reductase